MFEQLPLPLPGFVLSHAPGLVIRRESRRVYRARKKARDLNLPATLTLPEWLDILDQWDWQCSFCLGPFETLEHSRRLADNGATTKENCTPSCYKCNSLRNSIAIGVAAIHTAQETDQLHIVQDLLSGAGGAYAG